MLGGVGTFEGPVLGAVAVGGMAAGLPWIVIPVLADPLVFVIALAIVKFRPQGFISQGETLAMPKKLLSLQTSQGIGRRRLLQGSAAR